MNTLNVAELLAQQTENATRLSAECSDPDELRLELDRLTLQQ